MCQLHNTKLTVFYMVCVIIVETANSKSGSISVLCQQWHARIHNFGSVYLSILPIVNSELCLKQQVYF